MEYTLIVERHPAVALLEDEYGGAIERATLINKLADTMNIKRNTASMQVARLISKGYLVANGRMVQLPKNTKTQKHTNTGGVWCVTSVTKCDTETEETEESEEIERPSDRATERPSEVSDNG